MTKDDDAPEGKKNLKILEDFPKIQKHKHTDQTLFLRDVTKENRAERQKQLLLLLLLLLLRSEPTKTRERVCVEGTARARFSPEISKKRGEKVDFLENPKYSLFFCV